MKHYTRLCSLLLAGLMALSLAACSGTDAGDSLPPAAPSAPPSDSAGPSPSPSDAPEPSSGSVLPPDFTPDTSVEDLCLAASGIPGEFALFTVNGVPVTARSYLYWLGYVASYQEYYATLYGLGGLNWEADPTLGDYLKSEALNVSATYALVAAKAGELGFALTQEQTDELEASLALSIASAGGEDAFRDQLRKIGLDQDTLYAMNAASYYNERLANGLFADRPTAEEMDAYIGEHDLLMAKHILLMTVDSSTRSPLEESVVAEKKSRAEDILSQLQASGDLQADFDRLMHQYSEDPGLASYPEGYTFTAGEMVPEFEQATRALEYGQISGLVESASTGYHIILRLDPDTETARAERRVALMDEQLQIWLEEAEMVFSEEYDALDPRLFYEKFSAYQDAFAAEEAAASQEGQ